ncbi:OUTER MEMBRANE PROTEIN PORIN-RELATED [Salix purpurea]|uniref:OUTER MEMBRANE PROTEIN PORIN-RELATED n=1 Tax=Salix purpurea TaxID=77065 RepID=A0A9Q0WA05_SALPP|nr:OUTER MEMBRANE PROTEIN PORIN-RELATED [Salix purpurea]
MGSCAVMLLISCGWNSRMEKGNPKSSPIRILSFLSYLGTPPSTLQQSCVHILLEGFSFCSWVLKDLLYKDYQTNYKFTLTTFTPTGVTITSSGTKKGEFLATDVNTQLKNKNITTDIKVDTSSNVKVQYLHDYGAVSSSVGLTVNPTDNFSGVIGTNVASLGTNLSFDTKTGDFIKCNALSNAMLELSLSKVELIASLTFLFCVSLT